MSGSDGFSPCSQRESLDGVECSVTTEEEAGKAALERSGAMDHTMHLLTLQLFSYLHALLVINFSYTVDDDKLSEWNAVRQLCFTAPALPLVLASLLHEAAQPLHKERSSVEPSGW